LVRVANLPPTLFFPVSFVESKTIEMMD